MRALYLSDGRLSYRTDYAPPEPGSEDALVRVTLAGICATDLELTRGYKGGFRGVPGHEFVGVVERAPEPSWRGRRVTGTINIGCGVCETCTKTGASHCPRRTVLGILGKDGAFAEYVTLPAANLVPIPEGVADERAVFTEPLAAALRIREQLPGERPGKLPGERPERLPGKLSGTLGSRPAGNVAVVGPGRLGMLAGRALALAGARVTMLGRRSETLALARAWGLSAALVDEVADSEFDVVVDTSGNAGGLAHALRLVRPLGTLVMKSTFARPSQGDFGSDPGVDLSRVVVAEITVLGSRCGPFAPALRLLEGGEVAVDDLVDGEYGLADGEAAFAHAARSGVRKILLRP